MSNTRYPNTQYALDFKRPKLGIEIYTKESNGQISAQFFGGRRSNPDYHYRFGGPDTFEAFKERYISDLESHAEAVAARKKDAQKPHTLKPGDILSCSWGYEQTNIDFYLVTQTIGTRTIEIQEIGSHIEETGFMSGRSTPDTIRRGKITRHRVAADNAVKINSYQRAHLWDGKPEYNSWYA